MLHRDADVESNAVTADDLRIDYVKVTQQRTASV
jgi:hypothetical protein